jgi:hypothetical protein
VGVVVVVVVMVMVVVMMLKLLRAIGWRRRPRVTPVSGFQRLDILNRSSKFVLNRHV